MSSIGFPDVCQETTCFVKAYKGVEGGQANWGLDWDDQAQLQLCETPYTLYWSGAKGTQDLRFSSLRRFCYSQNPKAWRTIH